MSQRNVDSVGGIILGAGRSSRFGSANKLLATIDGVPMIRRVAAVAVESGLDELVAVLGYEAGAVADTLSELPISTAYNADYAEGQSGSVRRGVEFAQESGWDAAIVLLGDMPFLSAVTIDRLVAAYRSGAGSIVAPEYGGQRGNPVLFARDHFDRLAAVSGDRGGRELLRNCSDLVLIETDDSGVVRDIDSSDDLDGGLS